MGNDKDEGSTCLLGGLLWL